MLGPYRIAGHAGADSNLSTGAIMNEKEFLEQRLDNQKNWYSKNSQKNQHWHKRLQVLLIVCAACIPLLSVIINDQTTLKITTSALGVVIAVITGVSALYKFEEKWIKYRTTAEALKHEKVLYETRVEPYDGAKPFPLLVQRVENLISQENRDWSQYIKQTGETKIG